MSESIIQKVLGAIDEAIAASPTPDQKIAALVGGRVNQGVLLLPAARHGVTRECLFKACQRAGKVPEPVTKAVRKHAGEYRRLYAEMTSVANRPAGAALTEHRRALAAKLGDGATTAQLEGYGLEEFEAERQTLIAASKLACTAASNSVRDAARPYLEAAAAAAVEVLAERVAADAKLAAEFGFPSAPSEFAKSLAGVRGVLLERCKPVTGPASPDELLEVLGLSGAA